MSDNKSSGILSGILIGGAAGGALLMPFAIAWFCGLHVLYEMAALLCLLMWIVAEDMVRGSAYEWIATMPWWPLALACGALGLTTRILAMRGHLPEWAAGHRRASKDLA